MRGKIFISYRRASEAWGVDHVHQRLRREFGEGGVFRDTAALAGGEDWRQRIGDEIDKAAAIVAVFDAAWRGTRPGVGARIEEEFDPVRWELARARRSSRPVVPVLIDAMEPPAREHLPKELQFLLDLHFKRLHPGEHLEQELEELISDLRKAAFGSPVGRQVVRHTAWISLGVAAFVAALHASGATARFDDGFATAAQSLRAHLWWKGSGDVAIVEIGDEEYREFFGGRLPLDPEVMAIVVEAIHRRSEEVSACGSDRPVGINVDLAPTSVNVHNDSLRSLDKALLRLAQCRPVVLGCPQSIERQAAPEVDAAWMGNLVGEAKSRGARLYFASTLVDPNGLRGSPQRFEFGLVLADLAARTSGSDSRPDLDCACPANQDKRADCVARLGALHQWDRQALAVPFRSTENHYDLQSGLGRMHEVAAKRIVMFGGAFGVQGRYAAVGDPDAPQGISGTVMHSYLVNGALEHAPLIWRGTAVLGVTVAVAAAVSSLMIAFAKRLIRHDERFARRVPGYALAIVGMLVVPLVAVLSAARWPALCWLAGLAAITAALAAARAGLACFEMVIHEGAEWMPPLALWKAVRFHRDKSTALLRLAGFAFEAFLIVVCLLVVLVPSRP